MSKPYVVITSEHRVGSRWLHYMLADLLGKEVSPERGGQRVKKSAMEVLEFLNNNRIAKYHHGTPDSILAGLSPHSYQIIGVVRNPRDRGVSRAFHDYYHRKHDYQVKQHASSDFEAVKWVVEESKPFMPDNWRQINELMLDGYSTRSKTETELPYIWTSYEWMLDNTEKEVATILAFLGIGPTAGHMKVVHSHSFKNRSGRDPGQEIRKNTWRRKGQMLDWINWYDSNMLSITEKVQEAYWNKLISNGGRDSE